MFYIHERNTNKNFNNCKNLIIDATFFATQKNTQLLIIRSNDDYTKNFYTILFAIMKNKAELLYKEIFKQMNIYINKYKNK